MKRLLRYFLLSSALFLAIGSASGQSMKTHKVKRGETIYGIAHSYGLTEQELRNANPDMSSPDFVLKKGTKIKIPVSGSSSAATDSPVAAGDVRLRSIRMGVMLPLHNNNGEGRRMVEYYRGLLMACDSVKKEGISVDVYAWNTPDNADISAAIAKAQEAQCDIIFGPLYSKQMDQMSALSQRLGALLVIPFSINAPQLSTNSNIFQVYQSPESTFETTAHRFAEWFKTYHPVIVDCEDPNSTKGAFTTAVRKELQSNRVDYSLTSLRSSAAAFAGSFDQHKLNVVVLNSARTSDLESLFAKLKELKAAHSNIDVSVFGYTEWMEQAKAQSANFHKYNMYIPTPAFAGLTAGASSQMTKRYRKDFGDMIDFTPPLALTGFDHGYFFLRGLHKYGKTFDGAAGRFGYVPLQAPLKFERVGRGGYQNKAFMFVHYKTDGQVETVNY